MLTCFLKRVLPFLLTLTFGVAFGSIFRGAAPSTTSYRPVLVTSGHKPCPHKYRSYSSSPLVIKDVPDISVKDAARLSGTFSSTQKFQVWLGSDGRVWDVSPASTGSVDSIRVVTSAKPEPVPSDVLRDLAMDAARQIEFAPAIVNGDTTSTWVTVTYEFSYHPSPDCPKCSTVSVTITEDGNTLWHRESRGD